MNAPRSSLAALSLLIAGGAMAQTTSGLAVYPTEAQAAATLLAARTVGHWLYDAQGNIIGSVRGLANDGRTAVIMLGSYFQPGSHEARVPTGALSIVDGRATLQAEPTERLNAPTGALAMTEARSGPAPAQPEARATRQYAWTPREVGR